jgi:UDP-N-acetylmuramate--alanine ligase|tara:strand:- start:2153 stop:3508 length:1356 start_codon:yes stop_codon:yes gene_type:complete
MQETELRKVHFIGIGGIGMSALANYFISKNINVSGYDKVKSEITQNLENKGAKIFYEDNLNLIDGIKNIDLVIYTPAIGEDNNQLKYFSNYSIPLLKRSEVLGDISRLYKTIAVAGTHGKTTTSSIIAHILRTSNLDGVCFIGGITSNYNSNFLLGKGVLSVMEADEYDRSFLKLSPHTIVLTSMDADHLDIYDNKETLQSSFYNFTDLLENKKKLIVEEGLKNLFENNLTYGFNSESNLQILNIKIINSCYQFDIKYRSKIYNNFSFKMPGKYNLINAAGAVLSCLENEINMDDIRSALHSYKGVKRRFDIHVENSEIVYIDDYAHHPSEISALLSAVKEFYPNKKTIGVFQPHLYSRTRDFLKDFSSSLSSLDELFLLPIYPAREKPIKGINSSLLLSKVPLLKKQIISSESDLFSQLDAKNSYVLLTIGAGDIDEWVPSIIDYIDKND